MPARAARALALLLAMAPGAALADTPADVTALKSSLKAFTDGKGHYVLLAPWSKDDKGAWAVFYGDGKAFYRQRVFGYAGQEKVDFDYTFWEPRVTALWKASFYFRQGKYELRCEDRLTEFKPVADADGAKLIEAGQFFEVRWERRAYALARDELGNYYYVDKARLPERNRNYRLFVGPPGAMKLGKLKNIIRDSAGDIFSTPKGELRLVLSKDEAYWLKGKKRVALKLLPIEPNARLIYEELGVYTGQPLGTPCDDL